MQPDDAHNRSYLEGLRDGQIQELEFRMDYTDKKLESHELRLRILERISYAMLGVVGLIEILPALEHVVRP